jgi:heptosyltransferase-1
MRLLMVRTSALGDVVHSLPVLTALRRHFPTARLGWLVESAMAPVLAGHPDLDQLIEVRLRPWRRRPLSAATWREARAFFAALDGFAPDVVLDLMGNHKAGILGALTLSDRRIGFARRARREPSSAMWISEPVRPRGVHAVDRALSLLDALGVPRAPADFGGGKLFPQAPPVAESFLASHPERFALIHPGAGWANKRYAAAAWGQVARALAQRAGLAVWVAAAPGEEDLAHAVVAASGGAARAVDVGSLAFLAAVARRARLVLGGDTGPLHLAHALGAPVLMVMGPTDPARHGPYGAPQRALYRLLPCSFCYQRFDETKACLLDLKPELVAERALALLVN